MGAKRRQFTLEFKLQAVQLANDSDKSLTQVARELGIRPEMVHTWKRQAQSRAGLAATDVFLAMESSPATKRRSGAYAASSNRPSSRMRWEKSGILLRQRTAVASRRKAGLFDYLEVYSNRKRRHSLLGYKSPAQYEAERTLSQTTA